MTTIAFESRPLPRGVGRGLRARLRAAHRAQPFSPADPRGCVERVVAIAADLGLRATVYRGGLDLRGSEVDHVWVDVDGRVVDLAYPLFAVDFVAALRDYVAGDAEADRLDAVAAAAGVEQRVLGLFPAPLRYRGLPVWSQRHAAR